MAGMEQEIIKPDAAPKPGTQATGPLGSFLSAAGVTMLAATKLGAAMATTVWAFSKLIGLPDTAMWAAMALGTVPVLWAAIWTAGRAWHVEQRLQRGLDVDTPVFKLFHYWKKA
jgi:hypothetical protein